MPVATEAGDSLGTQRNEYICGRKPLPRNGKEDMSMNSNVYVCVCVCVSARARAHTHTHTTVHFSL
jgi:hypothetical protein